MKIIHLKKSFTSLKTAHDFLEEGKRLEKQGQFQEAIGMYGRMVKKNYQKEFGYQRMMILLRGLKQYTKELEVIEEALDDFRKLYSRRNKLTDKKAISTSRNIIKLLGLSDNLYGYPQPVPKWVKRKETVEKIISKKI